MSAGRLDTIKSLIEPANVIADVGCDHALIAEYCVKSGLAEKTIASDISEKCLKKARDKLDGVQNAECVCCDGIKYRCDTAVIAGMGGLTIARILDAAAERPKTVIACPHRNADVVRRTLIDLGYGIDADIAVEDGGKFYWVIRGRLGAGQTELNALQYEFGITCGTAGTPLDGYLARQREIYLRAPQKNAQKLERIQAVFDLRSTSDKN